MYGDTVKFPSVPRYINDIQCLMFCTCDFQSGQRKESSWRYRQQLSENGLGVGEGGGVCVCARDVVWESKAIRQPEKFWELPLFTKLKNNRKRICFSDFLSVNVGRD